MQRNKLFLFFLIILSISFKEVTVSAASNQSKTFSLLTCEPGEEAYSLFGHTAIRYKDTTRNIDLVFNYGLFNFNSPNFFLRFALGQTDYQLGITSFQDFIYEYNFYKRQVWEQELNLTPSESNHLLFLLEENYNPQNRTYRYNFLYNNCSTKPRDIIHKVIGDSIILAKDTSYTKTFRTIIHEHTFNFPWKEFGIDLCLGSKADKPISQSEELFAPLYLMASMSKTNIKREKELTTLAGPTKTILSFENKPSIRKKTIFITPFQAFSALLLLFTLITYFNRKRNQWGRVLDTLIFICLGLAGTLISFLVFFSEHPAVSPNYILFIIHPLYLLYPFFLWSKRLKQLRLLIFTLNLIVLTLFMMLWGVIPQRINLAIVPLALILLLRTTYYVFYKKNR